jgi:hypothetical protein
VGEKIYGRNIIATYKTSGTMTTAATETKSIGLPADARAVKVFAASTYKVHRDKKHIGHLSGLAKTSPALTQTATNYTAGPLGLISGFLQAT